MRYSQARGTLLASCLLTSVLSCRPRTGGLEPLIVTGSAPHIDAGVQRSDRGSIIVAVRPSHAPEAGLDAAGVALFETGAEGRPLRAIATRAGIAVLDTVPSGVYALRVQRLGFKTLRMTVTVRGECAQRIEVYLEARLPWLDGQSPTMVAPARATITTCARAT